MDKNKPYPPPRRALYSLEAAAALAGVTPKLLASAIENGDIPGVKILPLGPRKLRHVRSDQFLAWAYGGEPTSVYGPEADQAAIAAVAENFDPTEYDDSLFDPVFNQPY